MEEFTIIFILIVSVVGQMPKKPAPLPLIADIPFIRCDVCHKASKTLYKFVKQKRKEKAPVKLSEEDILTIVEKTCDPTNDYGEWISQLDIVEEGSGLKLVDHMKVGKCQEECKTISRACEESVGDIDTDIGEILWQNKLKLATFINEVCFQLSNVCQKNTKKYKKGSRRDFKFVVMDEKEKEAMKMMNSMKGIPGMPGMELYSKEDIAAMKDQMGVGDEEALPKEEQPPITNNEYQQNIGFFDTVKQIGGDFVKRVKSYFGYGKKSEL